MTTNRRLTGLSAMPVLTRVRLLTCIVGVFADLSLLGGLDHDQPRLRLLAGTLAILAIDGMIVSTFLRRRALTPDPLLLAPLAVLAGSVLQDPRATTGLCIGIVTSQSLYGSTRTACVRLATIVPVLPLSVALDPHSPVSWHDPSVLSLAPVVMLFTVLMRVLKSSLETQAENSAREALVADTSRRLLGCTGVTEVRAIMTEADAKLCELTPGMVLLSVERRGGAWRVLGAYGTAAYGVDESVLGACVPAGDAPADERAVEALRALVPGTRSWRSVAHHVVSEDAEEARVLIGMHRPIPPAVQDAVVSVAAQLSMAETTCRAHAELTRKAHHDELTEMPNRVVFFGRLSRAVEAAAAGEGCAVLIIDLDDFKMVNDTLGHGAGDELLVEIARRMTEVVDVHGTAARFGGDEFAVLLPGLRQPELAMDLAHQLRARLLEPVELAEGTVSVGCSIGVAYSHPGCSDQDLTRHADIAMYAAKAGGKNRVESFTEDRHGGIAHDRRMQDRAAGRVRERV